jgi:predicted transcriptional regulator
MRRMLESLETLATEGGKKMASKATEAVRKHREKLRAHGYVAVSTWIPAEVNRWFDSAARGAGMSKSRAISAILQAIMEDNKEV